MNNFNLHTSSGVAEDLIRGLQNLVALEAHYLTDLLKYQSQIDQNLVDGDEIMSTIESIEFSQEMLTNITMLRRAEMKRLKSMFKDEEGDDSYWCSVKHLLGVTMFLTEVWQGTNDDDDFDAMVKANELLIYTMTKFLGVEITSCAACFSDMLKANVEKKNGDDADE